MPTPDEARDLIRAGYGERLATYRFEWRGQVFRLVGPAPAGHEGSRDRPDTLVGPCTFLRNGKCELHEPGLKPSEGRLASHDRDPFPIRLSVANTWTGKRIDSVLAALERSQAGAQSA